MATSTTRHLFQLGLTTSSASILANFLLAVRAVDYFYSELDYDSVYNLVWHAATQHTQEIQFDLLEAVPGSDLYSEYGAGIFVLVDYQLLT